MSLTIFLTSPMAIEAGDVIVDAAAIGSRQVRLALAFLVSNRRQAVPRTQLADVVWPEALPPSWEGALRGVVSKVRAALAAAGLSSPEVLTSAFGCYQLHLPPDAVVDVEAATAALAAAEAALARGDADQACEHALVARRLASRPFLPEEEGEWAEHQRGELRGLLLRALEAAADAHLGRGEPEAAAEAAEAAIAAEPFREAAYRRLMAAHAAAGRGEALRAYERCRAVLAEELGVRTGNRDRGRLPAAAGRGARRDSTGDNGQDISQSAQGPPSWPMAVGSNSSTLTRCRAGQPRHLWASAIRLCPLDEHILGGLGLRNFGDGAS